VASACFSEVHGILHIGILTVPPRTAVVSMNPRLIAPWGAEPSAEIESGASPQTPASGRPPAGSGDLTRSATATRTADARGRDEAASPSPREQMLGPAGSNSTRTRGHEPEREHLHLVLAHWSSPRRVRACSVAPAPCGQ